MDIGDCTDTIEGSATISFEFSSTREVYEKKTKQEDSKIRTCRSCGAPVPATMSRCPCEFEESEP